MAFFGRGLFDDPFFGDPHRMMRNQMRDLDALLDPFGMMGGRYNVQDGRYHSPRQQMIEDEGNINNRRGRNPPQHRDEIIQYPDHHAPMQSLMEPFGFGFGRGLFGGLMRQMEQLQSHVVNDPNSHVYTQSTVISVAPGENGRPKYYEATESVRKAGDIKETRRAVRDTNRGLEKMEIGHHIGNRGHVIEKRRDQTTNGQIVENQQFIGLKDDEARHFDHEWSHASRRALNGNRYLVDESGEFGPQLAIEGANRSRGRKRPRSSHGTSSTISNGQSRIHAVQIEPRIEEPDEDHAKIKRRKVATKGGPQIVEID